MDVRFHLRERFLQGPVDPGLPVNDPDARCDQQDDDKSHRDRKPGLLLQDFKNTLRFLLRADFHLMRTGFSLIPFFVLFPAQDPRQDNGDR